MLWMFLRLFKKEGPSALTKIRLCHVISWRRFWRLPDLRLQQEILNRGISSQSQTPRKEKSSPRANTPKFCAEAPLVIVACGDKKASPDWYAIDVSLAVENIILTATSEGLSTCCVGSFDEKEVRETLKAPDNFEVLLLLAVGYSREKLDLTSKLRASCPPKKKPQAKSQAKKPSANIYEPQKVHEALKQRFLLLHRNQT